MQGGQGKAGTSAGARFIDAIQTGVVNARGALPPQSTREPSTCVYHTGKSCTAQQNNSNNSFAAAPSERLSSMELW